MSGVNLLERPEYLLLSIIRASVRFIRFLFWLHEVRPVTREFQIIPIYGYSHLLVDSMTSPTVENLRARGGFRGRGVKRWALVYE